MKMKKMTAARLRRRLPKLAGWTVKDGKLHREYKFADFPHAFGVHGDGGSGDREDGSSSGVVERLQPGDGGFDDARRGRDHAEGFRSGDAEAAKGAL